MCRATSREVLDERGGKAVEVHIYCTVHGVEKVSSEVTVCICVHLHVHQPVWLLKPLSVTVVFV